MTILGVKAFTRIRGWDLPRDRGVGLAEEHGTYNSRGGRLYGLKIKAQIDEEKW